MFRSHTGLVAAVLDSTDRQRCRKIYWTGLSESFQQIHKGSEIQRSFQDIRIMLRPVGPFSHLQGTVEAVQT